MKIQLCLMLLLIASTSYASDKRFPKTPHPTLTPGSLCDIPGTYRYPEQILYCDRDVNSFFKEVIFGNYRLELGYSLSGDRSDYKIDHFIPLCAGGSNNEDNLWPQHKSVSLITDSIESVGCEKLGLAKIKQKDLIALIIKAKMNLSEAPKILKSLKKLK